MMQREQGKVLDSFWVSIYMNREKSTAIEDKGTS